MAEDGTATAASDARARVIERRLLVLLTIAAALVFLLTSVIVDGRPWSDGNQLSDVIIYNIYGEATLDGLTPYRDFDIEYPPGALAAFVPPAVVTDSPRSYEDAFAWLMRLSGVGIVVLSGIALASLAATERRALTALGLLAVSPLLLGRLILQRFDLLPAVILAAAVVALLRRRDRLALVLLALAVVTKGYAIVALPLFLGASARRQGRRECLILASVFVLTLAVIVVPIALIGWDGLMFALREQTTRPLNRETTAGGLLLVARQFIDFDLRSVVSHGSGNFAGTLPDVLASLSVVAEIVTITWIWVRCLRSPLTDEIVLNGICAAVLAFIVFGKVLSPQYMVWVVALIPLLNRRWLGASLLAAFATALTQAYFPRRYFDIRTFDATVTWIIFLRNAALAALLGLMIRSLIPRTALAELEESKHQG